MSKKVKQPLPPATPKKPGTDDTTVDTRALVEYLSQRRTPEELEEAVEQLRKNETVEALSLLARETRLDREKAVEYVCHSVAPSTGKKYRKDLEQFLEWVDGPGPGAVLGVKAADAAQYVIYLGNKYPSPNTVRSKIGTIRLLYKYLIDGDYCSSNPFLGVRMPKAQHRHITRQKKGMNPILTNSQIAKISEEAARHAINQDPLGWCVLVMIHYGFRLGAMEDLAVVDRKTAIQATTKGDTIIRLTPEDVGGDGGLLEKMPTRPTKGMTHYGLRRALSRFLEPYSCTPHDLRHHFAVSQYKRTGDVFAVSRLLGHSSIQTTYNYLSSLGVLHEGKK